MASKRAVALCTTKPWLEILAVLSRSFSPLKEYESYPDAYWACKRYYEQVHMNDAGTEVTVISHENEITKYTARE